MVTRIYADRIEEQPTLFSIFVTQENRGRTLALVCLIPLVSTRTDSSMRPTMC